MKIKTIKLRNGIDLNINDITVLVGPNNVGKSQTLRDIKSYLERGFQARAVIINDIELEWDNDFDSFLKRMNISDSKNTLGHKVISGLCSNLLNNDTCDFDYNYYAQLYNSEHSRKEYIYGYLTKFFVSDLSSSNRLSLASSVSSVNPETNNPTNLLQSLFLDNQIDPIIKNAFKDAFKMDIALDYSAMTMLSLRVAEKMPDIPDDPRKAYPITKDLAKIEDQGDGFRSLVGIILGLLFSKGRIVLLDEPEAFLHPAQARFLGKWIGDHKDIIEGQLLISTHNANFLSGILASGNNVDIYRLNRSANNTTFTALQSNSTKALFENPLLSSQRVVESVFYRGVVVCEADADRAVYQSVATINHNSNEDVLFIHSQNKQTLHTVATLLKDASIPVAVIADIDALNSEEQLTKLIASMSMTGNITEEIINLRNKIASTVIGKSDNEALEELTNEIKTLLVQLEKKEHSLDGAKGALNRIRKGITSWSEIKSKGITGFDDNVRDEVKYLLDKLKSIGVFIVPVGELEGWMEVGTTQKNKWIVPALEKIHKKEASPVLVSFVKEILDFFNS